MSRSGAQRSPIELVTVGDFDPSADAAIEYDFIGRKIAGRYVVRAQIGGGGMADVFQATDESIGVDVAIKLLKPRLASDDLRARMIQEARAAAQVRHHNLVRVFTAGSLDATAFIVMELLAGPNLEQYLHERADHRLPCDEALALLLPAMDALHAVHERGYVHRDIKPGNILVTREPGGSPSAVVIDLGLVKADRALRTADSPPTTEVGRMLCTPGYTSPEQALGLPVDRRSDVYSMAITLYRVLAGRLPFHTARGKPIAEVLARHVHDEPTPLPDAAGSTFIPPAIVAVIESALRKDPAGRPQTMSEFAAALQAAASGAAATRPRTMRIASVLLACSLCSVVTWVAARSSEACTQTGMNIVAAPRVEQVLPPIAARSLAAPPDVPPEPPAAQAVPDTASAPLARMSELDTLRRRALARHGADVQRCFDRHGTARPHATVRVNVDRSGRVSARVVSAETSLFGRCVSDVLARMKLPSGSPGSFTHTYRLRGPR